MNVHIMPDQSNLKSVHVNRVKDEFGELHGAIRILAVLVHEFPNDVAMNDLIGWQASHVSDLAEAFISKVEARS